MRSCTNKNNQAVFANVIEFVGEQKISPYTTFSVSYPITTQGVIKPFWAKRPAVAN